MKAALCEEYGPPEVVRLGEVPTPKPGPYDILVKVNAASVSSGDARVRSSRVPPDFRPFARAYFGWSGPRQPILGREFSGVVAETGDVVTDYEVGDPVLGFTNRAMGCHAEYVRVPQSGLVMPMPLELPMTEAGGFCYGGLAALYFLRDRAMLSRGEKLLVVGASGSVGSAALQIGRAMGAEVTGLSSEVNLDLVQSLGATAMNYATTDLSSFGPWWDVVIDCSGTLDAPRGRRLLTESGRLLLLSGGPGEVLRATLSRRSGRRVFAGFARPRLESLLELARLNLEGSYRPVVSRELPFDQITEAHRLAGTGHKRGNIVLTIP